jgi:hypothetical protein
MADAAESYNRGMKKLFTQVFKDLDAKKLVLPKKEKVVEVVEEKPKSDDDQETPIRQAETDASESGTPSFMREEITSEERKAEEDELTPYQLKKRK